MNSALSQQAIRDQLDAALRVRDGDLDAAAQDVLAAWLYPDTDVTPTPPNPQTTPGPLTIPALTEDALQAATQVLTAARHLIEARNSPIPEPERPPEYYDSILADREAVFRHSPYALEERLSQAVTKGDETAALAALRAINAQGDKSVLAKDPLRSVKNSMIGSIAFLSRAAIQAGVDANDAFALSDTLTQRVEEMASRQLVLAAEEKIVLQFIALVRRRLEASYSPPVVAVIHYIENHLNTRISLADAAAYAGVHPSYLSARFKREVGLAFTAYIGLRKVQESSYFVRHTAHSVTRIAALYGFSSQSYYITVFKKVMGVTPLEYRRGPRPPTRSGPS